MWMQNRKPLVSRERVASLSALTRPLSGALSAPRSVLADSGPGFAPAPARPTRAWGCGWWSGARVGGGGFRRCGDSVGSVRSVDDLSGLASPSTESTEGTEPHFRGREDNTLPCAALVSNYPTT